MADVDTVLLIPPDGSNLLDDPHAPLMVRIAVGQRMTRGDLVGDAVLACHGWENVYGWRVTTWMRERHTHPDCPRALVLAAGGTANRHGCLTLADSTAWSMGDGRDFGLACRLVAAALRRRPDELALTVRLALPRAYLVFLDVEGKEASC